ncbi:MAG: type I glutamate--ammonia ligase [Candidatus Riflebacteria bacterium]|nr:type I glutamate--ammonia ligase [Candidatus Riflebacteria bacterium]
MFKSVKEVIGFIKKNEIIAVDLKCCDLFGRWRHLTIPARCVDESVLNEGFGFDGSSYGFKKIDKSDMIILPDITTGFIDPFCEHPTLSFICNIHSTDLDEPRFEQDPRYVCDKAEDYLKKLGIGETMLLGPEYEFYLFDNVSFEDRMEKSGFSINSHAANWNTGNMEQNNCGYQMPLKGGYHGGRPEDRHADYRTRLTEILFKMGIGVKYHHHEVGGPGQLEIETEFDTPRRMADKTLAIKYATKNLAIRDGLTATFMPKPMFGAPGSGFHVHFKLLDKKRNAFADPTGYAGMSKTAIHFITGMLVHARALSAFANPSTNSYKRLVPGYEAPVSIVFAESNRSAAIRIPGYVKNAEDKRFEYRAGDATANPYLMFASMIMAGIDGVKRELDPKQERVGPIDGNLYELPESERKKIGILPTSLFEALDALHADHQFLLEGGVFTKHLIETWIHRKREEEGLPVHLRPHQYEFILSYNC